MELERDEETRCSELWAIVFEEDYIISWNMMKKRCIELCTYDLGKRMKCFGLCLYYISEIMKAKLKKLFNEKYFVYHNINGTNRFKP